LKSSRGDGNGDGEPDNDRGMTQGEEQAHRHGSFSFLHQFAGHVVDGRDMIGIEGVSKTEAVSEHGRSQKNREIMKSNECPGPCGNICGKEQSVNADYPPS